MKFLTAVFLIVCALFAVPATAQECYQTNTCLFVAPPVFYVPPAVVAPAPQVPTLVYESPRYGEPSLILPLFTPPPTTQFSERSLRMERRQRMNRFTLPAEPTYWSYDPGSNILLSSKGTICTGTGLARVCTDPPRR